jgi:hypothetical protein
MLVVVGQAPAGWKLTSLGAVPEAARKEADRAVPYTKWLLAFKEETGYFKLFARNAQGRQVEFVCDAQGKDATVRTEISFDEVPSVVSSALKQQKPYFQPTKVHKWCDVEGKIQVYRFQGAGFERGDDGIYVSPNGKKVTEIK